jgi:hypothetical protein
MIEIFHHGFERMGAEAADNLQDYEGGWDIKHLKALRVLKECGVVSSRREGKTQRYSLCPEPLLELREGWRARFSVGQAESLIRLRNRVESSPRKSRSS